MQTECFLEAVYQQFLGSLCLLNIEIKVKSEKYCSILYVRMQTLNVDTPVTERSVFWNESLVRSSKFRVPEEHGEESVTQDARCTMTVSTINSSDFGLRHVTAKGVRRSHLSLYKGSENPAHEASTFFQHFPQTL